MYAIVDIETTGGFAAANGITEIAIIIYDGNKIISQFQSLINPQQNISKYITALTGITNEMIINAPKFSDIAEKIYTLLKDKIFVAHNVNFDFSFIKHHLKLSGIDFNSKKICTIRLGRKIFPNLPSYSLSNLCKSLNIKNTQSHRAEGDAKATTKLFELYLAKNGMIFINEMLKKSSKEQWLPIHINKSDINNLPSKPGVYYFYNNKNKVIYVGKAINIKKRVSSHFTNNDAEKKRQHFLQNIHKISYTECATELEALVFESTEIKRLWPIYNRSQKLPSQKYALYQYEDLKGYIRLAIDKKKKNIAHLYTFNLLHEGTVLLKNMVKEFELNNKLCFLDNTPFLKLEYDLLDSPEIYNQKIKKALMALNENLPTFAIIDIGKSKNELLCLLVEKGTFIGMGNIPINKKNCTLDELKSIITPYTDNDYIRNSIYTFAESYPSKKILF